MSKFIQETDLYGCMSDSSGGRPVRHCVPVSPAASPEEPISEEFVHVGSEKVTIDRPPPKLKRLSK
jgi:hypothetical protein